jgi:hypothetical protein
VAVAGEQRPKPCRRGQKLFLHDHLFCFQPLLYPDDLTEQLPAPGLPEFVLLLPGFRRPDLPDGFCRFILGGFGRRALLVQGRVVHEQPLKLHPGRGQRLLHLLHQLGRIIFKVFLFPLDKPGLHTAPFVNLDKPLPGVQPARKKYEKPGGMYSF